MSDLKAYDNPIILGADDDEDTIMGEAGQDVRRAVEAGVLYLCEINDRTCPLGQHFGDGFFHYCEDKHIDDYYAIVDEA